MRTNVDIYKLQKFVHDMVMRITALLCVCVCMLASVCVWVWVCVCKKIIVSGGSL